LQGIVSCGHCGRRLHVHYRGRNAAPGYHCCGKDLVNGRGVYCLNVGGTVIEQAVTDAFLQAITPAAIEAGFAERRAEGIWARRFGRQSIQRAGCLFLPVTIWRVL